MCVASLFSSPRRTRRAFERSGALREARVEIEWILGHRRGRTGSHQKHALESGVTRVNGVVASPDFVLRNGDRIESAGSFS